MCVCVCVCVCLCVCLCVLCVYDINGCVYTLKNRYTVRQIDAW